MEELITRLTAKAGLSPEQANTAIHTIKEFIKEKFPMMAGAIDNFLPGNAAATTNPDSTPSSNTGAGGGMMDKISDFIPGGMGEMAEEFAKGKMGGLLGGDIK